MGNAEQMISEAGLTLPDPPSPLGAYVPAVRSGNVLFLSGMLPLRNGVASHTGRLGGELDVDGGRDAVKCAVMNALSVIRQHAGGLDHVRRIIRMSVYLRTTGDFSDHASVADA